MEFIGFADYDEEYRNDIAAEAEFFRREQEREWNDEHGNEGRDEDVPQG